MEFLFLGRGLSVYKPLSSLELCVTFPIRLYSAFRNWHYTRVFRITCNRQNLKTHTMDIYRRDALQLSEIFQCQKRTRRVSLFPPPTRIERHTTSNLYSNNTLPLLICLFGFTFMYTCVKYIYILNWE